MILNGICYKLDCAEFSDYFARILMILGCPVYRGNAVEIAADFYNLEFF